jgi:hypothetical protein
LRTSQYAEVDEGDEINELQFIKKDYNGHDDDEIEEEEDNSN